MWAPVRPSLRRPRLPRCCLSAELSERTLRPAIKPANFGCILIAGDLAVELCWRSIQSLLLCSVTSTGSYSNTQQLAAHFCDPGGPGQRRETWKFCCKHMINRFGQIEIKSELQADEHSEDSVGALELRAIRSDCSGGRGVP